MKKELLTYQDPKSPVSEIFRTLRTNIQFMNTDRKLKSLLVTSTFPGEGKSWSAANLAVTFAQAGKRVILVDADMRKGRQYNIFGVLPKPGLSNYLSNIGVDDMENAEEVSIAKYIQETDVENLHVLTAGNVPPNPSELLVSRRMRNLLQELKTMCDLIIIDGTPCDLVSDAIILSRIVDSTMIITAQKETKKDSLVRIVKNIQNVGGKIAGIVVNKMDISSKKYNQSYYYGSVTGANMTVKQSKKDRKKIEEFFNNVVQEQEKIFEDEQEDKEYMDVLNIDTIQDYNEENNTEIIAENANNEYKEEYSDKNEKIEASTDELKTESQQEPSYYEQEDYSKQYENHEQNENNTQYEIEAEVQEEGKILGVKIDQNMDEKTKDILRQVNEYIESEKRRQGEKY